MLPDAAKGTQDAIWIVANPSEMFTDAPKMVSAPNVRSLFINGGSSSSALLTCRSAMCKKDLAVQLWPAAFDVLVLALRPGPIEVRDRSGV